MDRKDSVESALRRVWDESAEAARETNSNIAMMHAHSLEKATAKLSSQADEIRALRLAGEALREYLHSNITPGFDIPDEIYLPFLAALAWDGKAKP